MTISGEDLSPYSLADLDDARSYTKRETNDDDVMLTRMLNWATAGIEMHCRRNLVSRIYDGEAGDGHVPALMHDGDGSDELMLREYPVASVTAVDELRDDGSFAAIDIGQYRLLRGGILYLPRAGFPCGKQNIRVKMTAGYQVGIHDRELKSLEAACLRWVQVMWQDFETGIGRGTGFSAGGESVSLIDVPIPKDVVKMISHFRRIGG